MTLPEMEERFKINPRTLAPALRLLTHAGILNSRTGGLDRGYILARDSREISLYDIVQTIQGEPMVECCMDSLKGMKCTFKMCQNGRCKLFNRLNEVMDMTRQKIGDISLYDQFYNDK